MLGVAVVQVEGAVNSHMQTCPRAPLSPPGPGCGCPSVSLAHVLAKISRKRDHISCVVENINQNSESDCVCKTLISQQW